MQKFKDVLETLEDTSHVKRIDLFDQDNIFKRTNMRRARTWRVQTAASALTSDHMVRNTLRELQAQH